MARWKDKNDWEAEGALRINPHEALEYQPVFAVVATVLNAAGMSEKNIARKLGTSYTNFRKWKKENEDLRQGLRHSKEIILADLLSTGVKAAKGFEIKDRIVEKTGRLDENGGVVEDEGQKVKIKEIHKTIPPNERLLMFLASALERQLGRDGFVNRQFIEKKEEVVHKIDAESVADHIDRLSGSLTKYVESKEVETDRNLIEADDEG